MYRSEQLVVESRPMTNRKLFPLPSLSKFQHALKFTSLSFYLGQLLDMVQTEIVMIMDNLNHRSDDCSKFF